MSSLSSPLASCLENSERQQWDVWPLPTRIPEAAPRQLGLFLPTDLVFSDSVAAVATSCTELYLKWCLFWVLAFSHFLVILKFPTSPPSLSLALDPGISKSVLFTCSSVLS